MQFTPDFKIYKKNGELFAMIEAKNKRHPTKEWAEKLHASFFSETGSFTLDNPKYFFLVTPENTYVWDHYENQGHQKYSNSAMIFDSPKLFRDQLHFDLMKVSSPAFEMIVSDWLFRNESISDGEYLENFLSLQNNNQ